MCQVTSVTLMNLVYNYPDCGPVSVSLRVRVTLQNNRITGKQEPDCIRDGLTDKFAVEIMLDYLH